MLQYNLFNPSDNKHCPHCGKMLPRSFWREPKKVYGYHLNKEMVKIAFKILHWCLINKSYTWLSKEVFDEHKDLTQFQKLRYFGIIDKVEKSMKWRLTLAGYRFLKNEIELPEKVWAVENILEVSAETVNVEKVEPNFKSYYDFLQDYILMPYIQALKI
jgi:hypothetical protein